MSGLMENCAVVGKSTDHDQRREAFAASDVALPACGMMETMRKSATEKMSSPVGTREGAPHAFFAARRELAISALCEDARSTSITAQRDAQSMRRNAKAACTA